MRARTVESRSRRLPVARGYDAIRVAIQCDGGCLGRWQGREAPLQVGVLRISFGQAETMPITVNDNVDVVRIVVRRRRPFEDGVVEGPLGRPLFPQQAGDLTAVARQPGAAALTVEVELVPD